MLKLKEVGKVYENGTIAIDCVSVELPSVGMVAITGTSGSGKSTLVNLISNNDKPTKGEIYYDDKLYAEIGSEILTKDFAYIYQDFKLIDNLTVYQNIMIGHELANDNIDYDFVLSIVDELGLAELLDERVYSLSGGQMQRVAIARALVRNPNVIFADEPTGNLDTYNATIVYNLLRKLASEKLVVIVSHDTEISNWADRTISLEDGKIVSDEHNLDIKQIEIIKEEKTQEDEEIEEILQMQQSTKSKKISEFFSYKNKPKKEKRKKSTLTAKTSLSLSIALLNKDIVKKVFLTIVMVILVAFMTLSVAMTFATSEKTMANAINSNSGKKVFGVSPEISLPDYIINYDDMKKFDEMLRESKLPYYEIATGEVIANGWGDMQPSDDSKKVMAYYALMELNKMNNAVFTDNPKSMGIDMVLGKAPSQINEIAISKSYYDYLLYYKDFSVEIANHSYNITFSENDLLDKTIEPFGIKISGVFDDKNGLDKSLKDKDIESLNTSEQEELNELLNEQFNTNILINMIIKCDSAKEDWEQFVGVNSYLTATISYSNTPFNSTCFNYMPYNNAIKAYYNLKENYQLSDNEIIIDKNILDAFNNYLEGNGEEKLAEGSDFDLSIAEMGRFSPTSPLYPIQYLHTENVVIKKVVESMPECGSMIIMSDTLYNKCKLFNKFSTKRLIVTESVTSGQLSKLNKAFNKYCSEKFRNGTNFYLTYSIRNCPMTKSADFDFIYICQEYVCVPLMIVTILMAVAIIVVFYFDFVKTKAKDLLILKSLGAKFFDFFKIYGVFCAVLFFIQLLLGMAIGGLLIMSINIFGSSMSGYVSTFSIFYLDAVAWIFNIVMIFAVNLISLFVSIAGINNKNLRKSFQKLKK